RLVLECIAASTVIALAALALLTARSVRQLYGAQIPWTSVAPSLAVALFLGSMGLLLHWANGFKTSAWEFLLFEILAGGVFLVAIRKLGSMWIPVFCSTAFRRTLAQPSPEHG